MGMDTVYPIRYSSAIPPWNPQILAPTQLGWISTTRSGLGTGRDTPQSQRAIIRKENTMARQSVKTVTPEPKSKRENRKRKRTGLRARLELIQDEPVNPTLIVDSSGPPPDDGSGSPTPKPPSTP
jgi:hypothetical protein